MKKYSKVKKDAIAHYTRMIKWAEVQPEEEMTNRCEMDKDIGEFYWGNDCSYCIEKDEKQVSDCLLGTDGKCQKDNSCCNNLWYEMVTSGTWGTWVKRAKLVREYIRKNG